MIFPAGNGKSLSWLDNITAQDKKEVIGKEAIDMKELKRLAQIVEEDVNIEESTLAPTDAAPVPVETPISDEISVGDVAEEAGEVGEAAEATESDPLAALSAIKDLLDKGSIEEAKAAVEEALKCCGNEEVGVEAPVAEEAEIPVNLDSATGELKIDETPGDMVSVEIEEEGAAEDKSGEDESPEHEAKESPEFEAGEKEEEKEFAEKKEKKDDKEEGDDDKKEDDKEEKDEDEGAESKFGSSSKFYKIAFLSPENKRKLADYWKKSLGYDAAYVDMMTKDYEKSGKKG